MCIAIEVHELDISALNIAHCTGRQSADGRGIEGRRRSVVACTDTHTRIFLVHVRRA